MLNCANRPAGQNVKHLHAHSWHVGDLYRRLSMELDRVRNAQLSSPDPKLQVCFAVLVEDLESLLEQCENLLYQAGSRPVRREELHLVLSLSETVFEELATVLPGELSLPR